MEFVELKQSSFEEIKKTQSQYHFDVNRIDPRWDCVKGLGRFNSDFSEERLKLIQNQLLGALVYLAQKLIVVMVGKKLHQTTGSPLRNMILNRVVVILK